jgi:hypothetical protein
VPPLSPGRAEGHGFEHHRHGTLSAPRSAEYAHWRNHRPPVGFPQSRALGSSRVRDETVSGLVVGESAGPSTRALGC